MKKNRMIQSGLALLLLVAMAAGLMPGVGRPLPVNAAVSDKTIAGLGTDAIVNPMQPEDTSSPWAGSYVYFGSYDGDPVKYRVLSKSTGDFGGTTMLLDCDSILWYGNDPNNWYGETTNVWAQSKIKTYLNSTFVYNHFSIIEQNAMARSIKPTPANTDGNSVPHLIFEPLRGEKIFLLDAMEATNTSYGYKDYDNDGDDRTKSETRNKTGGNKQWWLRSADDEIAYAVGYVNSSGHISVETVYTSEPNPTFTVGVSPAFNLNLSSILFSSVISGTAGQTGAEYKLTLLDSSMNIAVEGDIGRSGDTITIPYIINGARAGSATQVSVLILDQEYSAGNTNGANVLAYEELNVDSFSASGTGTFVLPAELSGKVCGTDYFIYLVAEDVNGQKETDYASEPVAIDIQETKKITSVQVILDAPAAGQVFDTTAECSTEGVESVSAVWTDADTQSISGCAGYNRTYTLRLTIAPADGYVLDTTTLIQLNDGSRTVEDITLNPNDGSLSGTVTFETAKAKLLSISEPAPITGVANGTEKTAAAFGLPDTVTIETEDAAVTTAAAVWAMDEITQEQYDPSILSREQTFTVHGTITLPEQIDNPEGISLGASIKVTVLAAGFVGNPAAYPAGGTYAENQSVALRSSTQDAEIYYTTDGAAPDQATGIRYTGAIPVTGVPGESVTATIQAIAVKDGMQDSEVAAFTYTINLPALKYAVTVQNGTGSGEYEQGQTVTITADAPEEGKQFKGWKVEKGAVILGDSNAATTTFTMPAEAVSITAVYVDNPDATDIPDNPDNPDNPDTPDNQDRPDNPDTPDNQDRPDNPNILDASDNPDTEAYYILSGADSSWTKESRNSLIIIGSGDFSKFAGVKVDNSLLDKECYEAAAGSTVITLKAAYLNTLAIGKHTFEILWTDGSAKTVFTICEAEETEGSPTEEYKSPKTGDTRKMEENHSGNDKAPGAGRRQFADMAVCFVAGIGI